MRLAVVAGGWHWPRGFFESMPNVAAGADLFVVGHRNPELPIVAQEQAEALASAPSGPLLEIDRELYAGMPPTVRRLRYLGWKYAERENTVGDWGFYNQWLEEHNYRKYDVILNCHDDTYLRGGFPDLSGNWLLLGHGRYPEAPMGYVRGSLEFWKPELLDMLGGKIDLGPVLLKRNGRTDTPQGLKALDQWNTTVIPLRRWMDAHGLIPRVAYLSQYYRISKWFIEGERGYVHRGGAAPWSFQSGLKRWGLYETEGSNQDTQGSLQIVRSEENAASSPAPRITCSDRAGNENSGG